MAVRLLKNYTIPYSDQVTYHLSPLSSKSFLSSASLFINNTYDISVFLPHFLIEFWRFFIN